MVLELGSWTSLCPLAMQMEQWCMNSRSSLEKLGSHCLWATKYISPCQVRRAGGLLFMHVFPALEKKGVQSGVCPS